MVINTTQAEREANGVVYATAKQWISDIDWFFAAKHWPGRFPAPYMKGIQASSLRTGIVSSSVLVNQCCDNTTSTVTTNLGTNRYLFIAYCPVLSALSITGGATDVKCGGLYIRQTDSLTAGLLSYNSLVSTGTPIAW